MDVFESRVLQFIQKKSLRFEIWSHPVGWRISARQFPDRLRPRLHTVHMHAQATVSGAFAILRQRARCRSRERFGTAQERR